MTSSRVSIRQVAERAGVSRMTVSNVMNGRNGKVSPETLERVLNVVRELEYVPIPQPARQSRHVETRTIGLIFDAIEMDDIWGAGAYRGMRYGAQELDYDLLTVLRRNARENLNLEELRFLDRRSDGFIFLVPHPRRYTTLETLLEHGIPAATCFTMDVPQGVATVTLDNAGAMRQGTEYLLKRGHTRILHLAGWNSRSDFRHRLAGYQAAMQTAGFAPLVLQRYDGEMPDAWMDELKNFIEEQRITAVLSFSDTHALKAMEAVREWGYRIPEDISFVGMDDLASAEANGLTTFAFPTADVGRYAVQAVADMIQGQDWRQCSRVIPVNLVERDTVCDVGVTVG